ncbi:MAG: DUF1192 family protein [Alphaproteobacteria bacterium]|jgi:uncharacterized small protein (DUF1192 family)|nr:DUF1192 family protein [Alphaproteobacteria bacterium]
MEPDDAEPRAATPKPRNLDAMGIDELEAYIAELQAEVERARAAIAAKQGQKAAAEKLFGS